MPSTGEPNPAVQAQAFLIDPASMTVVWMNEAAARGVAVAGADPADVSIDGLVPVPGVPEALREVAATGASRNLRANLVSTAKGRLAVAVSIYRLPDGMLLVLADNVWQAGRETGGQTTRRPGRKTR